MLCDQLIYLYFVNLKTTKSNILDKECCDLILITSAYTLTYLPDWILNINKILTQITFYEILQAETSKLSLCVFLQRLFYKSMLKYF